MTENKNPLMKQTAQELLTEINGQFQVCETLRKLPAFQKYSDTDLITIVHAAQFLGLSPFVCLQGGLYSINGKVELSAAVMNRLIRQAGHKIEADPANNDKGCILKGTRADDGCTMVVSFSWDDAVKAGLANRGPWKNYTADMLFARCLSRLGRRLFPDVLQGCYVEGEISQAIEVEKEPDPKPEINLATTAELDELFALLAETPDFAEEVIEYTKELTGEDKLSLLPRAHVQSAIKRAKKIIKENADG